MENDNPATGKNSVRQFQSKTEIVLETTNLDELWNVLSGQFLRTWQFFK